MKTYEVPLTFAEHDSNIKIKLVLKNPSVICAYNGERLQDQWSFGSILECGPPPHTGTAIPKTMGPTGVGARIEYICRNGYLAKGPLIAECLPSEEWAVPECHGKKTFRIYR